MTDEEIWFELEDGAGPDLVALIRRNMEEEKDDEEASGGPAEGCDCVAGAGSPEQVEE
jgi:hypothetical protein